MHIDHVGTITQTSKLRPFHVQCSCGTAGDFSEKEAAVAYLESHFAKLSGISTYELVDKSDVVESPKPVPPLSHADAAGVPIPEETSAASLPDVKEEFDASEANAPAWPKKRKK